MISLAQFIYDCDVREGCTKYATHIVATIYHRRLK